MEKHNRSLIMLLRPVQLRLTAFAVCRYALIGLLVGGAAAMLALGAGRLWPLLYIKEFSLILIGAGLAAGFAAAIWKRASIQEAAQAMDLHGADDAITTALGRLSQKAEEAQPIVRLQREAAMDEAERFVGGLRERLPWPAWRSWRWLVYSAAAVIVISAALLVWPNPLDERAEALMQAKDRLQTAEREAEKLAELVESAELPKDMQQELLKPLEELRDKLDSLGADNLAALEELEAAIRELELAADAAKEAAKRLDELASGMSSEPSLRELGTALQDRDAAGVEQALDAMRSEMARLTPEQREALAEAMERLAEQQPQDGSTADSGLAEALEQAAREVREAAEAGSGEDALAALQDALARELSQGELEALAKQLAGQLTQSGQQLAKGISEAGGNVPASWANAIASNSGSAAGEGSEGSGSGTSGEGAEGGEGAGSGEGTGEGSGSGAGEGNGSGSGSGNGNGNGSGSGSGAGNGTGSGAGSGSGTGTGSGGNGSGAGSGQGAGVGVGSRNLVTTPRSMEGSGNVQQDGGPATGGQVQTGGESPMIDGMTRPYEEVYNEYATEAKQSLGRSQLPESMQEKVKQYFDQIQPNR